MLCVLGLLAVRGGLTGSMSIYRCATEGDSFGSIFDLSGFKVKEIGKRPSMPWYYPVNSSCHHFLPACVTLLN